MDIALLSAAVAGDNSGDAFIEDAVRRIVAADTFHVLPLLQPLSDNDIAVINGCGAAIICGTNLYQHTFACALTPEIIGRIRVPIIPMGIGASAPIGMIPAMNRAGQELVRELHGRCAVSSARDPATLEFLRSTGVQNAVLTGCPVMFHSLRCPDFDGSGMDLSVTPRSRLLHTGRQLDETQEGILDYLCSRYRPVLVLQSPYDIEVSKRLAERYSLRMVYDEGWQSEVYVQRAREQDASAGFRLHFGMLSLSYGKRAHFVAHDSRTSEFCRMMGLEFIDLRDATAERVTEQIDGCAFSAAGFVHRWRALAARMNAFLKANGLQSRLDAGLETPEKSDEDLFAGFGSYGVDRARIGLSRIRGKLRSVLRR